MHPPKPRLTLRVGITGHRPDKLRGPAVARIEVQLADVFVAIEQAAAAILRENREAYADEPPVFRLTCGFAEGADQIAVGVCPPGWTIEAILPFPKEDYLDDFKRSVGDGRDVRDEFEASLRKAQVVTELPAPRSGSREQGYATAGGYLLRQIDVLIAVWDGKPPKTGGTGAIAKEATDGGICVVWLSTAEESAPRLIKEFKEGSPIVSDDDWGKGPLTAELLPVFAAPSSTRVRRRRHARAALKDFYGERWRPVCRAPFYDLLKRAVNREKLRLTIRPKEYEALIKDWDSFIADAPAVEPVRQRLREVLLPRYVWTDILAVHFSHLYRSAYVLSYTLSWIAVFVALAGLFVESVDVKAGLVFLELSIITAIVLIVRHGRRQHWHERWLEYRVIAENLRHGRFLALLSEFGSIHDSSPQPGEREPPWMLWYIRATMREIGLPTATLNADYQHKMLEATRKHEIEEQIAYHRTTALASNNIDHFLHSFGSRCFVLTAWLLFLFLVVYGVEFVSRKFGATAEFGVRLEHALHIAKPWLILAAAGLPALGAALAGIRVQGDFEGAKERSTHMNEALSSLKDGYAATLTEGLSLENTARLLIAAARVMSEDLAAWQELYGRKRLTLPA